MDSDNKIQPFEEFCFDIGINLKEVFNNMKNNKDVYEITIDDIIKDVIGCMQGAKQIRNNDKLSAEDRKYNASQMLGLAKMQLDTIIDLVDKEQLS